MEGSKTKKTVFLTMITTCGAIENEQSKEIVDKEITMDSLFVD